MSTRPITRGGASPLRCLGVWLAVGAAVAGLGALVLPDLVDAATAVVDGTWRTTSFESLLGWLAAAAAVLVLGWLWLVAGLVTLAAARGAARGHVAGCPEPLRRLLLAACGAAVTGTLVTGLALPASADPLPRPVPVSGSTGGSLASSGTGADTPTAPGSVADPGPDLHGLPLPDRPRSEAVPDADDDERAGRQEGRGPRARTTPRDPVAPAGVHVVRPGDTLWDLAAQQLRADGLPVVTDADVDARWRAIWAANADVVGPDPDLIHPGQRLRPPATSEHDPRSTDRTGQ